MKDELIINGVTYRAVTPEVKEEKRLEGWIVSKVFNLKGMADLTKNKESVYDDTRMIEIKENEVIINKDMLAKEWFNIFNLAHDGSYSSPVFERLLKNLGFKKDGV